MTQLALTPVEPATTTRTVKLTYFKESGKYYSDGQYETSVEEYHDWLIYQEVRIMRQTGKLPGLTQCNKPIDFHIYVSGDTVVPALLLMGTDEPRA